MMKALWAPGARDRERAGSEVRKERVKWVLPAKVRALIVVIKNRGCESYKNDHRRRDQRSERLQPARGAGKRKNQADEPRYQDHLKEEDEPFQAIPFLEERQVIEKSSMVPSKGRVLLNPCLPQYRNMDIATPLRPIDQDPAVKCDLHPLLRVMVIFTVIPPIELK